MKTTLTEKFGIGGGCFFILLLLSIFPLIGLWTDGNLEWAILTFADKTVNVPYWVSLLISVPYWVSLLISVILNGIIVA